MSLHLEDPSPETDRNRLIEAGPSALRLPASHHTETAPLIQTASNSPSLDGLLAGPADPAAGQALFGGMFDETAAAPALRTAALAPAAAQKPAVESLAKPAVAPAAKPAAVAAAPPKQAPHNGYTQQDLNTLYSDQAGFGAADRQYKEIDFWVNRIAEGEGRFNSSEDLNDGGKLSVGIFQWTQSSGRLGGLMKDYQAEAHREGKDDVFNSTFGGAKQAASQMATLTGQNPGSISSSSIEDEFANAGSNDIFKRAQIQRARVDGKADLEAVNGMVPKGADGTVSGKQLAASLIMNNIGPGSPNRIFKAVDQEMFDGIKNQKPDVNKELGLSTDAKLAAYQFQHADELKAMAPADRDKALADQREAAKESFYSGLAGKYGDLSGAANQQTDTQLAQYEKDHGLDPNNPAQKADIDKARADIGIKQYADLAAKGPTIGQRVDNTIKSESDAKVGGELDAYEKAQATQLGKMTATQRASAIAKEKATLTKQVGGQMATRRTDLQRGAVQDNVSETDYDNHLITSVPQHLYSGSNYTKFHKGLENRLRTSMGEIDLGHRVNLDDL